jgi:sortase A
MTGSPSPWSWLERTLWAAGIALGLWTTLVVVQNRYYAQLPIPAASAAALGSPRLPGEEGSNTSGAAPREGGVERGAWLARLEVPGVSLSATVLEGSDDRTLSRAAGHIEYTPLPGEPGNIGIAGHRDTTFSALRDVEVGDLLSLVTASRVFEYRVSRTWIVNPDDVHVLDATPTASLTLVTCYPFNFLGNAPKRFIVRGELVSERPRS